LNLGLIAVFIYPLVIAIIALIISVLKYMKTKKRGLRRGKPN
jgi:hypothetical protein